MATQAPSTNNFAYDDYVAGEGLPVYEAVVGVDDITALPRAPWARTGGLATFIQLRATFESMRGLYVAEIPARAALEPERHLYEEEVFVLQGRGVAQVWQGNGEKLVFEWGEGSVFAFPRCTWHRLYNTGSEPVLFMGVTTAPEIINAVQDLDFVFNCDYPFVDIYQDGGNYFVAGDKRTTERFDARIWHTHFIPDARLTALDALEQKVAGGALTGYRMGGRFPRGHISAWPAGRYHKAHFHGPGAILLGLDGEGYVVAWDAALGPRPYQDGHEDQVLKINWSRNSIYSPPNAFFHQHMNSGPGPAKHVAVYGLRLPLGVHDRVDDGGSRQYVSLRDGGRLIEYEDEDPRIRKDFEDLLRARGIECTMPPVQYR